MSVINCLENRDLAHVVYSSVAFCFSVFMYRVENKYPFKRRALTSHYAKKKGHNYLEIYVEIESKFVV